MAGRLRIERLPFKSDAFPRHADCRSTGTSVALVLGATGRHLIVMRTGVYDRGCADLLVKRELPRRSNDYWLNVYWVNRGRMTTRDRATPHRAIVNAGNYLVANPRDVVLMEYLSPGVSLGVVGFSQIMLRDFREDVGIPRWVGPFDFEGGSRSLPPAMAESVARLEGLASQPADEPREVLLPIRLEAAARAVVSALWETHPNRLRERLDRLRYQFQLDARLDRAVQYIYEHFQEPCTTEVMAREVGLSQSSLTRLFRGHFRESPREFLSRYRVEQAQLLLGQDSVPVTEAARRVGLGSAWALRKAYRAHHGRLPGF